MRKVCATLSAPTDIAWLSAFRLLFGLVMAFSMLRFLIYGWVDSFFVTPTFHFKYWGFGWVEPLPRAGMYALFAVLLGLALAFAFGIAFRVAALGFAAGFTYLQLVDVTTYLNHYYLAGWLSLLLGLSPAHRAWSLHVRTNPRAAVSEIPVWWLYVFRFQVGIVYTFAGLAKAHGDWLIYAQPLRIWLSSHTDLPFLGPLFRFDCVPLAMSWAGFLFDTSVPWLLLLPRVRPWAYLAVIVFHVLTRVLFPIGMFPVIMVVSALVFFSPSWPRRVLAFARALSGREPAPRQVGTVCPTYEVSPRLVAGLLLYALCHVCLPLRHLAYGGDVRWHEQGMRFSWRVMIREKNGSVTFLVHQPRTGRDWYVSPHAYLTGLQEREMSGQPDLILQLAHHIHDDYARRGYGDVEVRVDASASLNGRRSQRLIDPNVDLATVRDGVGPAPWILPGPEGPPPHIQAI